MEVKNRVIKTELIEWKNLQFIQQDNFKELSAEAMQKLKQSIISNDFIETFKVWQSGNTIFCLDGFHRCKAFRELEKEGYTIPVSFPANFIDCKNKDEAAKLVLIYSSIYAKIETDGLMEYLKLNNLDFSVLMDEIDIPGIDLNKLQLDLKAGLVDEDALDDVPEPQKEAIAMLGDIFLIDGKHRVMCGDSTEKGQVDTLMSGKRADVGLTDPPYNVAVNDESVESLKARNRRSDGLIIKNDKMDNDSFNHFLFKIFSNYNEYLNEGSAIYVFYADSMTIEFMTNFIAAGFHFAQNCIWNKHQFVMTRKDYHYKHEPILYGWKKGRSHNWFTDRKQTSVWDFNRPFKNELHPTMKPVDLLCYPIKNNSQSANNIILDLFLGSGSTLIASEQTNRICYGMELDPIYIDVILRRYKNLYPQADIKCLNRSFDFNKLFTVNE